MTFKKILVPYDGSSPSENALKQAIELARLMKERVEIVILNVVQEIPVPFMMSGPRFHSNKTGEQVTFSELAKEMCQEMKNAAIKNLEEKKEKIEGEEEKESLTDNINFDLKTKVLVGYPPDKVVEFAEEEKFDAIVIGNVGLSGFSKFKALGSVSRSVAERAKCPVIIVH
jgi:nucleotide-binding universal stress UspA family protein